MAVANPRYRIITFRLSSNEYEHVYAAAETDAARSLSDFARAAVLERAGVGRDLLSEREQLRMLTAKAEQMMRMLAELDKRLSVTPGSVESDSESKAYGTNF